MRAGAAAKRAIEKSVGVYHSSFKKAVAATCLI